MAPEPTVLDALVERLTARGTGSSSEVTPAAVLWPDEARQWEPFVPLLRERVRLVTLGPYDPARQTGPAYWIKCVIDGLLAEHSATPGVPVVYLPGHARGHIRAIQEADDALKPLAELLHRGVTFAQVNGRDWTLAAFLESRSHGLGVDVADDNDTKQALLRARVPLADVTVAELGRSAPLRAPYFDGLMSTDLDRDILRWLDDRSAFEGASTPEQLAAFQAQVTEHFHAQLADGEIALARRLGVGGSRWERVWARYAESPGRYPHIEELLAAARPERSGKGDTGTLFEGAWGRWPQDNMQDEDRLRSGLVGLRDAGETETRERLIALEQEHAFRRKSVWGTLGRAPLAFAMEHLGRLASATRSLAAPATPADAMRDYADGGWAADDAVIQALATVKSEADRQAVEAAVRPVYQPWLEETARRFQQVVGSEAADYSVAPLPDWPAGTCLVFFDGLRYDIARRLEVDLRLAKREVVIGPRLAALPTITSTAKPAVSPVVSRLGPGRSFAPAAAAGGADLTVVGLRTLLTDSGYQVLALKESGDPAGRAWTEAGDLDEIGHLEPWNLPEQSEREVEKLVERVCALLDAGWKQVVVVTDHGWLYLPGGLPKVDFPISVTKDDRGRKGRTARLAESALAPGGTVPWHWDPMVRMAVAPGIATFVGGAVYEHGGISPQECVTPVVTVRKAATDGGPIGLDVRWDGLRARISVSDPPAGAQLDIRRSAGDAASTVVGGPRPIEADGFVSALVRDEDEEGAVVFVVVVRADGGIMAQAETTVGG